jgi:polysaccharide deacetylase 2 family uncharacterized protein YibQ
VTRSRNNRYKRNPGGRFAARIILGIVVLIVGLYLTFRSGLRTLIPSPGSPRNEQNSSLPANGEKHHLAEPAPVSPPDVLPEEKYAPEASTPEEEKNPAGKQGSGKGRLAVIIDDMGSSMQEARELAGIGVPLTFSIIPGLRSYGDVAGFATTNGIEIMIHIPMQPKGWPQRRLEANGLLLSMDDADISGHLEEYMREIPKAVGVNNHMGSEFTEHEDKMRVVLEVIKGRGLFFIDSMTSPRTVGLSLAREMGVMAGRRNVFLDNQQDGSYIRGQLAQAVRQAKKTGAAIAICHPHQATIQTLAETLPALKKQGIELVPASQLVR